MVAESVVIVVRFEDGALIVVGHCEQTARFVSLVGEQTSKGTCASAQMKAQHGSKDVGQAAML